MGNIYVIGKQISGQFLILIKALIYRTLVNEVSDYQFATVCIVTFFMILSLTQLKR